MQLAGEQRIAAPRSKVWAALNDPTVLKAAIPGCESLDQDGADSYSAVVVAKIGPVRARFKGRAALSNIRAPESYTISGEGAGGVAGMAKGAAELRLEDHGAETVLHYVVKADVGGKLAQVGSRLIESTARKYANDFFARFNDSVTSEAVTSDLAGAAPSDRVEVSPPRPVAPAARPMSAVADDANVVHLRRLNWALIAIVVALVAYVLARAW
ncbi:MAG TPA: carbon monoxide dehydrogenase subunit G [Geminicoccaceae bacterium]|nr:carbon monoxide dehydrogenase subunit G [Geminicoccaceae bacterium]